MINTLFNAKIKMFRSNNASELAFTEFFAKKGVMHQLSCVERPQQNSMVERKHQYLLNVARTLYFQSRISIKFWSECVLTATCLININPSPILKHQTPYEVLYGKAADYYMLRVFGCLAFASTLSANRNNFQPRARVCVFPGYPSGVKGYKLYDGKLKEIFLTRDVVFHENIFPFHIVSATDQLLDPFPDLVLPTPPSYLHHDSYNPSSNLSIESHNSPQTESLHPGSPKASYHNEIDNSNALPTDTVTISEPNPSIPIRHSQRASKPPKYLMDYHCNLISQKFNPSVHPPHHLGR